MWSTGLLVQFSMFHFALVLGLLCKILTQDPGALGRAESDPRFTCIADLVEKNEKPTVEQLDALHQHYMEELSNLFDQHKTAYGVEKDTYLNFV